MTRCDDMCCRQDVLTFMHRCNDVTQHIMACFALGLGLPEDFFAKVCDAELQPVFLSAAVLCPPAARLGHNTAVLNHVMLLKFEPGQ